MARIKTLLISFLIILNLFTVSGCWNYREVDRLAIVAGMAVDKENDNGEEVVMTLEVLEFTNERDSRTSSKIVTIRGKTIFDTARNGISVLGKKLYWSHLKAVIISEQIASEGVIRILDWINRDSETRADINIVISRGNSAKEILMSQDKSTQIKSFRLRDTLDNEARLSKSPHIELWEFANKLADKGTVAVAPVVKLEPIDGVWTPQINGTAIFKKDKLVGYLDGEETKDMLFIQNEVKGGVLVYIDRQESRNVPITLEIFKSKTKVEPVVEDGIINFKVDIKTTTALDELGGTFDYIEDKNRAMLEATVAKARKERMEKLIKKVQSEYGADIFGFASILREKKPKVWKTVEYDWENKFKDAYVKVDMDIHIRNSAMLSKPLEIGD